jgi:hypothetical protein
MLYAFFWVIPRRLNSICRSFGNTLFHLHRRIGAEFILHLSAYEDGTGCSETSALEFRRRGITQKKAHNSSLHIHVRILKMWGQTWRISSNVSLDVR